MNWRVKHTLIQGNTWMRMWWLSQSSPFPLLHQENKNEHFVPWCRRNLIGCWWFNLACKLAARETVSAKSTSLAVFLLTCWHIWRKLDTDLWCHRWLTSQGYMACIRENEGPNSGQKSWSQWSQLLWGFSSFQLLKNEQEWNSLSPCLKW